MNNKEVYFRNSYLKGGGYAVYGVMPTKRGFTTLRITLLSE
ncbi:hypothetical protein ABE225_24895 [Priestia megaterium]